MTHFPPPHNPEASGRHSCRARAAPAKGEALQEEIQNLEDALSHLEDAEGNL